MEGMLDALKFAFGPVRYAKAKWSGKGNSRNSSNSNRNGGSGSGKCGGSLKPRRQWSEEEGFEETPMYVKASGYFSHLFLIVVSYVREALFGVGPLNGKILYGERHRAGYVPLLDSFETFYIR